MDTTTLIKFITPFLPFLLKVGQGAIENATESAASQFGEASWQKAQAVWTALGPKLEAKDNAEAVTDVAKNPDDEDYRTVLRVQFKKLLASETALANQLTQILQSDTQKTRPTTQITQNVKGNENQVIGQISGGQVFGNVTGSVIISGSGNSVTSNATEQAVTKEPAAAVKTILVLAANPKGTSPLRLGEEVREIQAGLERSKERDRFRIEQRWAVTAKDVRRALLDCQPQIVHFSGHGVGTESTNTEPDFSRKATVADAEPEGLLWEDVSGNAQRVSTDAIAGLFSLFSDEIECVVLNACYSAVQADAIAQHIPYVVGMKKAIGDRAAIEFSLGFYDGLLAGRPVDFAYKLGCNAIELQNMPEHLTPVIKQKGA